MKQSNQISTTNENESTVGFLSLLSKNTKWIAGGVVALFAIGVFAFYVSKKERNQQVKKADGDDVPGGNQHQQSAEVVTTHATDTDLISNRELKLVECPSGLTFKPVTSITDDFDTSELSSEAQEKIQKLLAKQKTDNKAEQDSRSEAQDGFGSTEHIAIGDIAFHEFCAMFNKPHPEFGPHDDNVLKLFEEIREKQLLGDEPKTNVANRIVLSKQLKLTAGQIVALAGDFFAVDNQPICFGKDQNEKERRFQMAYHSLAAANPRDVTRLLTQIDQEHEIIAAGIRAGKKPSIALEKGSMGRNFKYMTLTKYTVFPGSFFYNRYATLAQYNFDHFADEARVAYRTGHRVACLTAIAAKSTGKVELLVTAFAQELFACHFLTDLFAAGHVRTPRKALYDYVEKETFVPGKLAVAGLLAKEMHDEDSRHGLVVKDSLHGTTWKALGDDCYFEPSNRDNAKRVIAAVKNALQDVYQAYQTGKIETNALSHTPTVDDSSQANSAPLFKVDSSTQKVLVRKSVNDPKCQEYESDWSPASVLFKRKMGTNNEAESGNLTTAEQQELTKELSELEQVKNESIDCKLM